MPQELQHAIMQVICMFVCMPYIQCTSYTHEHPILMIGPGLLYAYVHNIWLAYSSECAVATSRLKVGYFPSERALINHYNVSK